MGSLFNHELLKLNTKILIPQLVPNGFYHSYFSFAAKFEGSNYGIKWQDFRKNLWTMVGMVFMLLGKFCLMRDLLKKQ